MPSSPPRDRHDLDGQPLLLEVPVVLAMYSPASSAVGTASTTIVPCSGVGPEATALLRRARAPCHGDNGDCSEKGTPSLKHYAS